MYAEYGIHTTPFAGARPVDDGIGDIFAIRIGPYVKIQILQLGSKRRRREWGNGPKSLGIVYPQSCTQAQESRPGQASPGSLDLRLPPPPPIHTQTRIVYLHSNCAFIRRNESSWAGQPSMQEDSGRLDARLCRASRGRGATRRQRSELSLILPEGCGCGCGIVPPYVRHEAESLQSRRMIVPCDDQRVRAHALRTPQ